MIVDWPSFFLGVAVAGFSIFLLARLLDALGYGSAFR